MNSLKKHVLRSQCRSSEKYGHFPARQSNFFLNPKEAPMLSLASVQYRLNIKRATNAVSTVEQLHWIARAVVTGVE